jgi:hypothetical protein
MKGDMNMATDLIFVGWNRAVPGREALAAEHFQEFLGYLGGLQQAGKIESFEPVLLSLHGGDLNGFILVRGDSTQVTALQSTDDWLAHATRGGFNMEGFGTVRGVTGEGVASWMAAWSQLFS